MLLTFLVALFVRLKRKIYQVQRPEDRNQLLGSIIGLLSRISMESFPSRISAFLSPGLYIKGVPWSITDICQRLQIEPVRGKSLFELWVSTFLPDWQSTLIFVWFTSKSHYSTSHTIVANAQEVWDESNKH